MGAWTTCQRLAHGYGPDMEIGHSASPATRHVAELIRHAPLAVSLMQSVEDFETFET